MIGYTLYPAGSAVDKLCGSSRAHCKYSLKLLHDVGVVEAFGAGLCVAGVLLVVGGVLLPIEMIPLQSQYVYHLSLRRRQENLL